MSKESEALLKQLRECEIKCAEQQDVIKLLEGEIRSLNGMLNAAWEENRKLAAILVSQSSNVPKPDAPNNKEDDNTKDESSAKSAPVEDDECPFADVEDSSKKTTKSKPKAKPKGYKEKLVYECAEFLERYSFKAFYNEIAKSIIGQETELKKLLAVIYNYIYTISIEETPERCNTALLTAPSGNGKSALFKALKEFFAVEIPSLVCSRKDASRLTPEGYRGTTVNDVLSDFAPHNRTDIQMRYGILWLDEFDKLKFNHDEGPQVQSQLLAFMDGHVEKHGNVTVDTRNIFWVCAGSFNEVRQKKKINSEKTIGFVNEGKDYDVFDDITREDVLQLFSHETVGRFNLIINFKRLSEMAIIKVIAKTLGEISRDIRIDAVLSEDYMNTLVKTAANSEFGCRKIYSTLYETCLQACVSILQDGIYGIDEMPVIVIDGPNEFTILDEAVSDQIKYETWDEA